MKKFVAWFLTLIIVVFAGCSNNSEKEEINAGLLDEQETIIYMGETAGYVSDYLGTIMAFVNDASGFNFSTSDKLDYVDLFSSLQSDADDIISKMSEVTPYEKYSTQWNDIISFIEITAQISGEMTDWMVDGGKITKLYDYLDEVTEAMEMYYDPAIRVVEKWFDSQNSSNSDVENSSDNKRVSTETKKSGEIKISGGGKIDW